MDAGSFTNEATATGTPAGGTLNPAKGDKTVEGIQNPSWTILKTAAEKSYGEVGESLNYTITVTNTGNVTISNVVVVDPKATTGPTYVNGDANSNQKLDVSETWTYTATYLVKAADIEAGSFTNEATVTGTPAGGTLSPAKGSHEVVALVARPNIESTPFNTAVSGDVSKNDTYPAGSVFTKTSEAKNGVVVLNSNGTYTYQPKDGFTGVDTFTYKVCLPSPNGTVCEETTVTIVVGPNAVNDKFVSLQNREVSASVVGNDQYPTGSVFTATSSPANGKLTFNSNGTFTYVPNQNFTGKDTFTYKVCFNEGDVTVCEDATVEIEILPFDTEPDVNATFVNVPVNGNVATNDKVTQGTTYGD
ncbi:MAG: Ig-like domain-containing protein, partial [Microcystis sp. LE19-196.1B]|nr:Ig-like domain-containing protein [Microcystis sp. LE19-196.1B]